MAIRGKVDKAMPWFWRRKTASEPLEGREGALQRCKEAIEQFERYKEKARWGWIIFQGGAVVLSGLTPILILWNRLDDAFQALPAALGAIFAGLVAVFGFPENKGRWAEAIEALKGERVKYLTRTSQSQQRHVSGEEASETGEPSSQPTDQDALDEFVTNVQDIVMTTTREWRRALLDRLPGDTRQTRDGLPPTHQGSSDEPGGSSFR